MRTKTALLAGREHTKKADCGFEGTKCGGLRNIRTPLTDPLPRPQRTSRDF